MLNFCNSFDVEKTQNSTKYEKVDENFYFIRFYVKTFQVNLHEDAPKNSIY